MLDPYESQQTNPYDPSHPYGPRREAEDPRIWIQDPWKPEPWKPLFEPKPLYDPGEPDDDYDQKPSRRPLFRPKDPNDDYDY